MSMVEKNLTLKNIEQSKQSAELQKRQEYEKKFLAVNPEDFEGFRTSAQPIEQVYLSHPSDEFSLRVRAQYTEEGPRYSATLKDRGECINGHLARLEVETPISPEAFHYYADQPTYPTLKKLRAEPAPGVTIDYIEGLARPLIEIEQLPNAAPLSLELVDDQFIDVTMDPDYLNETLAHTLEPMEQESSRESLDDFAERIVGDMIGLYSQGYEHVVAGVSGMSGSGKTSAVKEIARQIEAALGPDFAPIVISTDDYHRGRRWLEDTYGAPWTNWDDPRVYDTAKMALDLSRMKRGWPLQKRHFDFSLEESVTDEIVLPRPFILVEGIFAGSPDLQSVRQLHYEVPSSPATSIGRDIRRLVLENRGNGSIGSPEARLRYQLETALPTYQHQERPRRNTFPAYCPPLAKRAFLLQQLTDWRKSQ